MGLAGALRGAPRREVADERFAREPEAGPRAIAFVEEPAEPRPERGVVGGHLIDGAPAEDAGGL